MSNVRTIRGGVAPEAREVNPDVIEAIEDLLQRARSGDLQGVICIGTHHDRTSGWVNAGWCYPATIGQLAMAQHAMTAGMFE